VSTDANGAQGNKDSLNPVFSPDGTKVAFYSFASNLVAGDTNFASDIFVVSLGYRENGVATAIDANLTLSDVDSATLSGASVTISDGFVPGDTLGFTDQNARSRSSRRATTRRPAGM
jgi:Tol biopolymer transport system component